MTKIKDKIISGLGGAAKSIKIQKPVLAKYAPEISSMHDGTLNVQLEQPLAIAKYDIEVPAYAWEPNYPPEGFGLVRASIQFTNYKIAEPLFCFLYYASRSAHRGNPFLVEVLTHTQEKAAISECLILLAQPCRTVEWVVVG